MGYTFHKIKLLFAWTFLFSLSIQQNAFSQNQTGLFDNSIINIKAALNFHYLVIPTDSNGGKNVLCPSFSLGVAKSLNQQLIAEINLNYNSLGYRYSSGYRTYKTNNLGIDLGLNYNPIKFIGVCGGVEPICILSSKEIENATSSTINKIPISGSGFNVLFYGGLIFNISNSFSLFFNYNYSLPGQNIMLYDYFQVGINFKVPYNNLNRKVKEPGLRKEQAYNQIKELKNNALLVKLSKYDYQMLKGKDSIKYHYVYKAIENQKKTNDSIYYNFKKYFKFCPVYFYYSASNPYIKSGQLKGYLLNDKLLPDTSIKFPFKNYYVAGFEEIQTDTTEYNETTEYLKRSEFKSQIPKNAPSASGSGLTVNAFIFKDSNMVTLKYPFPYYYKMNVLFNTRLIKNLVLLINQNLFYFYYQSLKNK